MANLTNIQLIMIIVGTIIGTGFLFKIVPMIIKALKDKKIDVDEQQEITDTVINVLKKLIELSQKETIEDVKEMAVVEIQEELRSQGIENITADEIRFLVEIFIDKILEQVSKEDK